MSELGGCGCEHFSHFDDSYGHPYGKAPAGPWWAGPIGAYVCTPCAEGHYRAFVSNRPRVASPGPPAVGGPAERGHDARTDKEGVR